MGREFCTKQKGHSKERMTATHTGQMHKSKGGGGDWDQIEGRKGGHMERDQRADDQSGPRGWGGQQEAGHGGWRRGVGRGRGGRAGGWRETEGETGGGQGSWQR